MPPIARDVTLHDKALSPRPQFVFLHGWGATPGAYAKSLSAVRCLGLDVFAPALPGHAHQPLLRKGSRDLASVARHLVARLRPFIAGQRHTILAGHSLGGALSTLTCAVLAEEGRNVSLLLLSPTGACSTFGPREWLRAMGDLKEPRARATRPTRAEARRILSTAIRTGRLGWEARNTDLTTTWVDLARAGIHVTAVHAVRDRVVNTEPLIALEGIGHVSVPRPHDWPTWDDAAFRIAVEHHLEQMPETRA